MLGFLVVSGGGQKRRCDTDRMPKVVPSQVVTVIDQIASVRPEIMENPRPARWTLTSIGHRLWERSLALVQRIPEELIVLGAEDYTKLTCAEAGIETTIESPPGEPLVTFRSTHSCPRGCSGASTISGRMSAWQSSDALQ